MQSRKTPGSAAGEILATTTHPRGGRYSEKFVRRDVLLRQPVDDLSVRERVHRIGGEFVQVLNAGTEVEKNAGSRARKSQSPGFGFLLLFVSH